MKKNKEKKEKVIKEDKKTEEVIQEQEDLDNAEILEVSNEEIDKMKEEIEAQKDKFLRVAAEYDNYRKRTEKEKISIYSNALCSTVKEILPIADSIGRAIDSLPEGEDNEYKKGLNMINDQLNKALEKLGVESFGKVGDKFDPELHSAVLHIDNEEFGENEIASIFQKGYKTEDKVIRYAMVQVAN